MTATKRAAPVSAVGTETDECAYCNATMRPDQEWCLECGSARTLIHRPPDWRIPLIIVCAVIAIAVAGFAFAISKLSGTATPARAATAGAARAASGPAHPSATTVAGTYPGWPAGLSGWTVELTRTHSRTRAEADVRRFTADGVAGVGMLRSTDHPAMVPHWWVIFSKRYPDAASAQAAAAKLVAAGMPKAVATEVAPPGGL
jgi:hypothetical protein